MRHDGAVTARDPASARPVRVLAAGGTIAMRGERAVPALDAAELVEQLPQVAGFHLEAETVAQICDRAGATAVSPAKTRAA